MKFHAQQSLGYVARALGKLRNVSDAGVVDVFPQSYEVAVPGRYRSMRLPCLEGSVSLLQDLLISLPSIDELMFHVEHSPIEKSATTAWTLLDQPMHFRIYNLHRKHRSELRKRGHALTAQFRTDPLSRPLDADPGTTFRQIDLTVDSEPLATRTNEIIKAPRSK
jgi:hypothetical protein